MKIFRTLGLLPAIVLHFSGLNSNAANPIVVKQLTFEQAREITWQNSHVLKQVGYLQQQRDQERNAARGLYFPNVGIMASAVLMSDPIHLDLTPVKNAITPLYQTLGTYGKFGSVPGVSDDVATQLIRQKMLSGLTEINNQEWDQVIQEKAFGVVAATVQWPIYAGGKIRAANKAAVVNQQDVNEISRQKQGELMSELVERYFGVSLANQVVNVRQAVYSGLQQHLDDAVKLEKEGLISRADVLHARVFHAQASRELSKAIQQKEIVGNALNATMSVGDTIRIEAISNLFYIDSIEPEAYFQSMSVSKNPLLGQVESKKKLAGQAYHAERSSFLPAVMLQGTYDIVNKDLSTYIPDWEVGIGLKWTLFDGTSRYAKVKAASLVMKQAEEYGMKAEDDISAMISKLYRELTISHDQLLELEHARTFAEEYLRARETEFNQEMTNSTEVIDARLALAQVNTERLQAMYNYDVTLARLLEYAGIPADFSSYATRADAKTERYE